MDSLSPGFDDRWRGSRAERPYGVGASSVSTEAGVVAKLTEARADGILILGSDEMD